MSEYIFHISESVWPSFDIEYSKELKSQYPEIWDMSGGQKSDEAHEVLLEIYENGGYALTPEQFEVLNIRESWGNRHFTDNTTIGHIAQVKWLIESSSGEAIQKKSINQEVSKLHLRHQWETNTKSSKPKIKDPKGGLTAAGRKYFNRTEGTNLKPGVKGRANTPEKMRRKGSFLTRFFTNPSGPMKDEKGRPTRLALSAAAWGEPVPQDRSDAAALAAKGRRLLERYENSKQKKKDAFEIIEKKVFTDSPNEEKFKSYLDSMDDKKFDEMFPEDDQVKWNIPMEEKWIFDVAGAFLRRSITNRRKKRRKKF
jgi:hypothetical protein